MSNIDFSGTAEISDEGIKKHFKSIEPWGAIFELVWNGLDANATNVDITLHKNTIDSVDAVSVLDNGDGIDFRNSKDNFGKFNDSSKKEDAAQHGSHGRGRLAFHRLSHHASWHTKSKQGLASISIKGANIKHYEGTEIQPESIHSALKKIPSGTYVELTNVYESLPEFNKLQEHFSTEFGWYLALNQNRNVSINGSKVTVPSHEIRHEKVSIDNSVFDVKIIRWDEKPTSEQSYTYLLNSLGTIVYKQLSSFNKKPNFFTSIFIQSPWADNFISGGENILTPSAKTTDSSEWKNLIKLVNEFTQRVYEDYLRRYVDDEIERYVKEGIFPEYSGINQEYANWRMENTKLVVKAVYAADPAVFNNLNKKQKKVIVRLLDKLAISNENDSLFEVLNSVLELDEKSLNLFAEQLKKTQLQNIISTIEVLEQRQAAVHKMRELVNVHYKEVLETPDLQKIIESNTWLFGHRYETLGAEEDTFTNISKNLRDEIKDINLIEIADLEDEAIIEGANRQSDLFLARKILSYDSFGQPIFRCILIEIKRPSIALNVKHLQQLDAYAGIIKRYPEFSADNMHFDLILVGRKISSADTEIKSRMQGQISKGEMGLVSDDPRMKRYVLNWYTLLNSFELSNDFLLKHLKLKRESLSDLSKENLVESLQTVH